MSITKNIHHTFMLIAKSILCLFIIATLIACNSDAPAPSANDSKTTTLTTDNSPKSVEEKATYKTLETPIPVSSGVNIEVAELFWYGCGHCFALEPYVKKWQASKPDNAEFVKIPAIFSDGWSFHAQAYYTMEALGVLAAANDGFFNQIHVDRKPINDLPALVEFLTAYDKTEAEVTTAFNSFAVDTKLRNAVTITRSSTATGVPTILVDGKYLTNTSLAGGQEELLTVINELVEKAAAER